MMSRSGADANAETLIQWFLTAVDTLGTVRSLCMRGRVAEYLDENGDVVTVTTTMVQAGEAIVLAATSVSEDATAMVFLEPETARRIAYELLRLADCMKPRS